MAIVTSDESRAGSRDLDVPPHERGMAHRSYPSPDGKWMLLVEMNERGALVRCRLAPLNGSSAGRPAALPNCRSAGPGGTAQGLPVVHLHQQHPFAVGGGIGAMGDAALMGRHIEITRPGPALIGGHDRHMQTLIFDLRNSSFDLSIHTNPEAFGSHRRGSPPSTGTAHMSQGLPFYRVRDPRPVR